MKRLKVLALLSSWIILSASLAGVSQPWSLEKCLNYARANNQQLLMQAQGVETTRRDVQSARAQLFPQIEARAGLDHYWQIPVQVFPGELLGQPAGTFLPVRMGTPWMGNYGLEASLRVVDLKTWQNIRLAALDQQGRQSELQSLHNILSKQVTLAFYRVQLLTKGVQSATGLLGNYRDIHRLIVLQFDKGLTDKITLNQSYQLWQDYEERLLAEQTDLRIAALDLKFWMGYPLADTLHVGENSLMPLGQTTKFDPQLLPDYTVEKLKVERAQRQYASSLASRYPSLELTSNYRRLGFGQQADFIGRTPWFSSGYVGLQLRVPLLSLRDGVFNPARQKALHRQADLAFQNYLAEQEKNYLRQVLQVEEARQRVLREEENLQLAQENERLMRQKLEKEIINMTGLKQVQHDLHAARQKLLQARLDWINHSVELQYLQHK